MRLTDEQRRTILRIVRDACGEASQVLLFGSRVDDHRIGGDVDLLIETTTKVPLATELSLAARLEQYLGEPVDVIVTSPEGKKTPIIRIAELTGVGL